MSRGNESFSDLAVLTSRAFREAGGWMLLVFGLLAGTAALSPAATSAPPVVIIRLVFSVLFVLVGAIIAPSVHKRIKHRHSLASFGRDPVVERRVVHPEERCHERCVVCDSTIEAGLVRHYREDITFAGVPLLFGSDGYNHYCLECARAEMGHGIPRSDTDEQPETRDERTREPETESV